LPTSTSKAYTGILYPSDKLLPQGPMAQQFARSSLSFVGIIGPCVNSLSLGISRNSVLTGMSGNFAVCQGIFAFANETLMICICN